MLCFFAHPVIYIFPREKSLLFPPVPKGEVDTAPLTLNDILTTYEDSKEFDFKIKDVGFKNIEENIYIDLADEIDNNKLRLTRCISIGILKKIKDSYYYNSNFRDNLDVEVSCEVSDSNYTCYLEYISHHGHKITNKSNPLEPLIIHPGYDGNTSLNNVYIVMEVNKEHIASAKLKIKARHKGESKWKYTAEFNIYRNQQKSLDDFKKSKSNKDSDFFVLPRVNPNKNQTKCIKQLQIINNQVFARNASLKDFQFVEESGEILKTVTNDDGTTTIVRIDQKMEENARKSLSAFKYDPESDTGCKSGNLLCSNYNIKTVYPYKFSNFGHSNELIKYLHKNYIIGKESLYGKIYDRNFLFGDYNDGDSDEKIEGIVNLYRKVVIPFVDNFRTTLLNLQQFSHEWLSCPKYNANYKRGTLKINTSLQKKLYYGESPSELQLLSIFPNGIFNNNTLPLNAEIEFHIGADKHAFDNGMYRYKVESVKISGQTEKFSLEDNITIPLSNSDKQLCNDRANLCNIGNYKSTAELSTVRDKTGVNGYNNFGIPYFINNTDMQVVSEMDQNKRTKKELLEWNEQIDEDGEIIKNWYKYPNQKKPNTNAFGIDCSGLVLNCLLWPEDATFTTKFEPKTIGVLSNILARNIGIWYSRKITNKENFYQKSYLSRGDIVYTKTHIATCVEGLLNNNFKNNYVSLSELDYNNRYFTVIHSYGDYEKKAIRVDPIVNGKIYTNNTKSFILKTLSGPFKHCGNIDIKDSEFTGDFTGQTAFLGRIYLWSNYEN